jgi:hypothetical protein
MFKLNLCLQSEGATPLCFTLLSKISASDSFDPKNLFSIYVPPSFLCMLYIIDLYPASVLST